MGDIIGKGYVSKEHLATTRSINSQINHAESRGNLPIVNSRPLRIGLDISSVCNINCIFCLAKDGRCRKSDEKAFRTPDLLDHYEPLLPFVELVIFSSYEAILNPHFEEFVQRVHTYNAPIQLFSNGLDITPEKSEFLLQHGMKSLWCSFHGATSKTYESIMRGSNYDTVLQNLMHLKVLARKIAPDFKLTLVFCAMRRTIEELPAYVDLAKRVGAAEIQVNYLLVTHEDMKLDKESMYFHQDLYDRMVIEAKAKAARFGIALNHQPLFSSSKQCSEPAECYRPWEHLNVDKHGVVQICCGGSPVLGNMFEEGFSAIWNAEKMAMFRARVNSDDPPKACKLCTRGRENTDDPTAHLTYLRGMPSEQYQKRLHELGLPLSASGKV